MARVAACLPYNGNYTSLCRVWKKYLIELPLFQSVFGEAFRASNLEEHGQRNIYKNDGMRSSYKVQPVTKTKELAWINN